MTGKKSHVTRRGFLRGCAATTALVCTPVLERWGALDATIRRTGPAYRTFCLDQDWMFGGKLRPGVLEPGFDDRDFAAVTLPHCVASLSWQNWNPLEWESVWAYRRHFKVPVDQAGMRFFIEFDRVMAGASPVINGHKLSKHIGGYLPFQYEVTDFLQAEDNVLSVAVDSRWLNAPPSGSPRGPASIDYLLPGGMNGSVYLRGVPAIFLKNVFARSLNPLDAKRTLDVTCTLNSRADLPKAVRLGVDLQRDGRTIASQSQHAVLESPEQEITLKVNDVSNVALWDVENPHLYDVLVTLFVDEKPLHNYRTRIGFREARFDVNGFFLNGKRLHIFGLDRHELYPYLGYAAPTRLLRKDAEILRRDFHCNMVRCSHYPQSEAFLDACDELGLMVWEELPGWQYLGDKSWRELAVRDVGAMVRRDRNHPAVIIWGVRINESPNDPSLYHRTRELAKSLDETRPTSGTMTSRSKETRQGWHQDVFAFDDYHAASPGVVGIDPPLPGVPYLVTETVGQFNYNTGKGFTAYYRRAGNPVLQQEQAIFHAQAHSKAGGYPRCAGLLAWCGFEYMSLMGGYHAVKYPGVSDVFRIPKLGASFYMAQGDPAVQPVILPSFYWDFGPRTPGGPGARAAIFSNCDRLVLFIDGKRHSEIYPDKAGYPNVNHAPFFANLELDGTGLPELRINGYIGDRLATSRSFSSDHAGDRLVVRVDDMELQADGSDATRLMFACVDKFGAPRPFASGKVSIHIKGPGTIVGENPFNLGESGGAGAVYIRTLRGRTGRIEVAVRHARLGGGSVEVNVRAPISQAEDIL